MAGQIVWHRLPCRWSMACTSKASSIENARHMSKPEPPLATAELGPWPHLPTRSGGTIEICMGHDAVYARADGIQLAPLPVRECMAALCRDIDAELGRLTYGLGQTQKLVRYRDNLDRIGDRLGRVLFGNAQSPLSECMYALYRRARATGEFVAICLCCADPEVQNLPWELAVWRHGSFAIALGTDEYLALVRQASYPSYVEDRTAAPDPTGVCITHVTADRAERQYTHEAITAHFADFMRQNWRIRATACYSEEWAAAPSAVPPLPAQPARIDIFQLVAHGARSPCKMEIAVAAGNGRGRGLELDVDTLISLLGRQRLPRLFVMLTCWSFDHFGQRGVAADLLRQGGGAVLGILGELRLGKAAAVTGYFYGQLLQHGRMDLAVQRLRGLLRRHELFECMTPDAALPADWFRPVLMIRRPEVLHTFAELPRATAPAVVRSTGSDMPDGQLHKVREVLGRVRLGRSSHEPAVLMRALRALDKSPVLPAATREALLARWEAVYLEAVVAALGAGVPEADILALASEHQNGQRNPIRSTKDPKDHVLLR